MTSTFIEKLYAMVEEMKLIGAQITRSEVADFVHTCDAVTELDEYDTMLNGYPLVDFKLANAFSGAVLPRYVKLMTKYGMENLLVCNHIENAKMLTPAQFMRFQLKVFNLFKKTPTFDTNLEEASRPVLLNDVLDCVELPTGILVTGNPVRRPVELNFTFSTDGGGIGEISQDEFYFQLVLSIILRIKG